MNEPSCHANMSICSKSCPYLKFDGKTVIIVIFYLGLFLHHVFTFCPWRLHRAGRGGARPADQLAAVAARLACRAAVVGASRGRALGCRCTQATARAAPTTCTQVVRWE